MAFGTVPRVSRRGIVLMGFISILIGTSETAAVAGEAGTHSMTTADSPPVVIPTVSAGPDHAAIDVNTLQMFRPTEVKYMGGIEGYRRYRASLNDGGAETRRNPSGYRSGTLLASDATVAFGLTEWYELFEIAQPLGSGPYGVTRIEGLSGATGDDPSIIGGPDVLHLIEAYDEHLCDAPAQPDNCPDSAVHRRYLGGVLVNLGQVTEPGPQYINWVVEAAPGTVLPMHTGDDNRVVFVHTLGTLGTQGEFVAEDPDQYPYRVGLVFAGFDSDTYDVGDFVDFTLFAADIAPTALDRTDRVYRHPDEGPISVEGAILFTRVDGVPMADCNTNAVPDEFELTCHLSGLAGTGACPADACPYFNDMGTTGFQSPLFANPLETHGYGATCIPAASDCNTNDVPDECEPPGDFNGDGAIDLADFIGFEACFTGPCTDPPSVPPAYLDPCCAIADADNDGDVDLTDFSGFQQAFGAP